jgi:hypothetical protein
MKRKTVKGKAKAAKSRGRAAKDLSARKSASVRGGIALLVPAVQKAREAASTSITDGTSNTLLG